MIDIKEKSLQNLTFIDLFAGLGGFRIALSSLGAKCVYSNEWDKDAQKVYTENFGETPEGDITKVDENTIPNHDILCAGFPCQAFSISGKQRGFEDSRGTLFFDVARIIKAKRPKIVFMENVKNFATHDSGRTLEVVRNTIRELGYTFSSKVLNAVDYGVPQKRERIYMVCFRNDLNIKNFTFPKPFKLTKHVEDFLLNDEEQLQKLYVNRTDTTLNGSPDNKYANTSIRLGIVNKGGQGERIYSTKGIAITLSAYGGGVFAKTGGYLVNGKTRRLHPKECARIMGYPDSYKISSNMNQAYKQFGNSVVIDVLQYIAMQIGNALEVKPSHNTERVVLSTESAANFHSVGEQICFNLNIIAPLPVQNDGVFTISNTD
jgi:DNA (cytosine-5)-methyltransferase 1